MTDKRVDKNSIDWNPPIFSSWRKIYLIVVINLLAWIILLYFFSKAFQ